MAIYNRDRATLANLETEDALSGRDEATLPVETTTLPPGDPITGRHWSIGDGRYYTPAVGRVHISGLFDNRIEAGEAVNALERMGVPRSDISVIARSEAETVAVADATGTTAGTHAGEGAGAGSLVGGTVGAILGALAATATSIVIPGVGVLIAGPLAGAIAGAGAGSFTGGLLGALIGVGIPEETARTYTTGLSAGGIVVVADVAAPLAAQARLILGDTGV